MSNLPPGVTGNEFEISGPDYERDEWRQCEKQDVSLDVATSDTLELLRMMDVFLTRDEVPNPATLLRWLTSARESIQQTEIDTCPFAGIVTVAGYQGSEWWDCPVCGGRTEKDLTEQV